MLIVANWKAYIEDVRKAKALATSVKRLATAHDVSIVLAPPAPLLGVLAATPSKTLAFAAQDVSATIGGAHTGEATAAAYAAAGATYAIIGHSERRGAGDTDAVVREKLGHAIAHKLTPILCVGESSRDAEGKYLSLLREALTLPLTPLSPKERAQVIVAYEPIWAIGKTSAEAIGPTDLYETVLYIRKVLADLLPGRSAARAKILYGGSVEPINAHALASATGVNGFLVGHASVEQTTFSALVKALA